MRKRERAGATGGLVPRSTVIGSKSSARSVSLLVLNKIKRKMQATGSARGESPVGSNLGPPSSTKVQNIIQMEVFDPNTQSWKRWLQRLEDSLRVFKITTDEEKVAYLLYYIGL